MTAPGVGSRNLSPWLIAGGAVVVVAGCLCLLLVVCVVATQITSSGTGGTSPTPIVGPVATAGPGRGPATTPRATRVAPLPTLAALGAELTGATAAAGAPARPPLRAR